MDRNLFLGECAKHLDEGRRRLHHCLGLLDDARAWHRPNRNTVSVGNLVLHLCGNVDQWVNATLGGTEDTRARDREFDEPGPIPRGELLALLDRTVDRALAVIATVEEEQLARTCRVQAFEVTGTGILLHVVEHFSYHVGQVTLHTKLMLDTDTGYYSGISL